MKNLFILKMVVGGVYTYLKPLDTAGELMGSYGSLNVTQESGVKVLKSQGGPGFDVNEYAVPGQVTVVVFYVSWCSACKRLDGAFNRFLKVHPDVAVRKIEMKDKWNVPWAKKQFGLVITGTPHLVIFDADGSVLAQDDGRNKKALRYVYKWMDAELRKRS